MRFASIILALLGLGPSIAQAADRPVVVELFTSQGCSSCPPADEFLRSMAQTRDDVLALAFHVTYWDNLGWRDPFALATGTERQRLYGALLGTRQIYTPQMVIDGRFEAVGSDRRSVGALIDIAADRHEDAPRLSARRMDGVVDIALDAAAGQRPGFVFLVGYDPEHETRVGRGENGGRTLTEANIVRSLAVAGEWRGQALALHAPIGAGERQAVLLQAEDGRILAATRVE